MKKFLIVLGLLAFVVFGLIKVAQAEDYVFDVTMTLLTPIVIFEDQALLFPDAAAETADDIEVLTTDGGAAQFHATGSANEPVTATVVQSSIDMTNGSTNIAVDTFDVDSPTQFDGSGEIAGIRIGAIAHVEAEDASGAYTGFATFRLVYQ